MAPVFPSLACLLLLLSIPLVVECKADDSKCPEVLQQILPCLNYVQGKAAFPPQECCKNFLTVHLSEPVCLCELIEASVTGSSQLPAMNISLQMNLGPACNVKTNPRVCPGLLGISPTSPEAKIFESGSSAESPSGTPSTTPSSSRSGSTNSTSLSSTSKNSSISARVSTSIIGSLVVTVVILAGFFL